KANHSQFSFQGTSSPVIEEVVKFHDHTLMVSLAICSLVLYLLTLIVTEKLPPSIINAQEIELI
ncbi:COX2 oxidase, partial [Regulus satrapa]|nr:COX2 oxidase [Regulus satrapa]